MSRRPTSRQHDSLSDKIHRYRSVLLVISVPIMLIVFVLFFMPGRTPSSETVIEYEMTGRKFSPNLKLSKSFAIIFDAGSSGSRVHVFCFDQNLDLVPIGEDLELFVQLKPSLSEYASDPQAAVNSLTSLLDKAQSVVPQELRSKTPVRVGATARLRALGADASERILQAVRDLLRYKSALKPDGVPVLDGTQEGSYEWVTINYLLGRLGKKYSDTVGVVDLGGGSVQMAYAISQRDAATSLKVSDGIGEDAYVKEMYLMGTKYYLYVHSYLHYGLLAARAEILKVSEDSASPCILAGYDGSYKYGGNDYKASASLFGSNLEQCKSAAIQALKINDSCTHMKCTFGGVLWNGGGGDGKKNLFVASFFFDRAAEAGFIDRTKPVAKVRPADFEAEAKRACQTRLEDAKSAYPRVDEGNLPYICMDLIYQHTLLVVGFGIDPWQEITLVKQVQYQKYFVEAAWPLGSAIEAISASK